MNRVSGDLAKGKKFFLASVACIFLITGLAKIISALGTADILDLNDPVFGISFRSLMLAVGLLECLSIPILILTRTSAVSLWLIAWLATAYALYRLGLSASGWQQPCPCLGSLTASIHLSTRMSGVLSTACLVYVFLGSYGLLAVQFFLKFT